MTRRTRLSIEALEDRSVPSFGSAVSYPAGPNPQDVVAADFNNDGRLDLATANAGSNSVSVLLGNPDGTFQPALTAATGLHPEHMAVGDFNNDGNLDLATANNTPSPGGYDYNNDITMLMGAGDGTFQGQHVDTDGWDVKSLAAGDFNGDGYDDLVYSWMDWSDWGYPSIAVRLSNVWGFYLDWTSSATSLTVADVNGDGNLDVAGTNWGVSVYLGNGDGTLSQQSNFATFGPGANTQAVTVGDFTGDGIPDLAATSTTSAAILAGYGDGTFGSPILENTNNAAQGAVAAADLNGDSRLDVVTADRGDGMVTALLGLGNGMLSLVGDHPVGSSPVAVAVGDFNGDGRPDAATANAGSNTVSVLLNDGAWHVTPSLRIGDVTVTEGNAGTHVASFIVSLTAPSDQPVTVQFLTANGTAASGADYQSTGGTLTFAPGETSHTITVGVFGDRLGEPNETFLVNLSSATNAMIGDGQAVAMITDDEPRISVTDATLAEGQSGTTLFTFVVTLSVPNQLGGYDLAVTMSYRTTNGTAHASSDYIAKNGTLNFAPGETTKTITIVVKGDSKREANETFYLDLFGNGSNSLFSKNRGIGTILNDD